MLRALAIAKRDLWSFFATARGYVTLGLIVAIWGFYFFNILGRYNFLVARAAGMELRTELQVPTLQQFVIEPYFQLVLASFIFLIPILAMRSFAEERQRGTFELLMTAPGSIGSLILGKFLALLSIVWTFTFIAALLPTALLFYGSPDDGLLFSGILAVALCGAAFSALALACGARSNGQLSAAVGGTFLLGLLLLLHTPAEILPGAFRYPLELFSAYLEASAIMDGYFSAQGVVYFLSLTIMGLGATYLLLVGEREDHRLITWKFLSLSPSTAFALGTTLLVAGGVVVAVADGILALLGAVHIAVAMLLLIALLGPALLRGSSARQLLSIGLRSCILVALFFIAVQTEYFIDLSSVRRYTVSAHASEALRSLTQPIEIRYFRRGDLNIDTRAERFLQSIAAARKDLLSLTTIDPADYPSLTVAFGIHQGDILQIGAQGGASDRAVTLKEISESGIIAAIQSLLSPTRPKIYLVDGAGSARKNDSGPQGLSKLAARWQDEGFTVVGLPSTVEAIPNDASLVAVIGPRESLPAPFAGALEQYLHRGGHALLALDPLFIGSYLEFLDRFGVQATNGVVIDHDQLAFSEGKAGLQPLVQNFSEHPIVNRLGSVQAVVMNVVAPLGVATGSQDGFQSEALFWASSGSFFKEDVLNVMSGREDLAALAEQGEGIPPIALGVAVTRADSSPALVVYGDSDWLLNTAIDYYANRDLALNSAQWLVGNKWALVERTRTEFSAAVALSPADLSRFMVWTTLLAELLILLGLIRLAIRERNV